MKPPRLAELPFERIETPHGVGARWCAPYRTAEGRSGELYALLMCDPLDTEEFKKHLPEAQKQFNLAWNERLKIGRAHV